MTFNPVHSPFSSSSIYYSTFKAFLKGNTEEIEKLSVRTWNYKKKKKKNSGRPIKVFGQGQFFWVCRVAANIKFLWLALHVFCIRIWIRYPQWFFSVFLDRCDIGPRVTPKFPHFAYFILQTKINRASHYVHIHPVPLPTLAPPPHTHKREKKDKMSSFKLIDLYNNKLSLSTTKPTKWVAKDPKLLHADSEDSDQTGRMPRLICVSVLGAQVILLVLSCCGSYPT